MEAPGTEVVGAIHYCIYLVYFALERDRIRPQRNEICDFNELTMVPCAPLWPLVPCAPLWSLVYYGPTRSYVVLRVDLLHICIFAQNIKNRNLTSSHLLYQSGNVFPQGEHFYCIFARIVKNKTLKKMSKIFL